jgi:Sec-independent protein translocase protein TatA
VLGPEKLPRVVSEIGRWVGRARVMARQFREQLEEEVQLEEARKAQVATPPYQPPPPPPPQEAQPAPPETAPTPPETQSTSPESPPSPAEHSPRTYERGT